MKALHALLPAILFLFATPQAHSQGPGRIQGRVVDATTQHPLTNAHVRVLGTDHATATDDAGTYQLENLPEGRYKVKVSHVGYADFVETDVVVVRDKTTYINEIHLVQSPLQGDSITVTPDLAVAPVSQHSFQREEIRRSPGTNGDVLRAMGSMPGVTTSEGEFAAMSVRGGGVYDNLILVDNIPFDKINHFEGGSPHHEAQGGRFSVFTAGLIERATFHGGGFGPEYGRKKASVLDLTIKEGNMASPTLSGTYTFFGPEVNYDGPTYVLDNTSLVVNYRDFDMRRMMEIADDEDYGDPTMSDLIVKTTTHLNPTTKINLVGLYSTDRLIRGPGHVMEADDLVENDIWDLDETRWLTGANVRWLPSDRSVLRNTVFVRGNDRFHSFGRVWADRGRGQVPPSRADLGVRDPIGVRDQQELELGWKTDFHYDAGPSGTLNAGAFVYRIGLDDTFTQNEPDTLYEFRSSALSPDADRKYAVVRPEDVSSAFDDAATNAAAYASYELGIGRFTLTPGVRYSYSGFSAHHNVAPRLQLGYSLTPRTTLNAAVGQYHQKPLNRSVASAPENMSLRDETATHVIAGMTHQLREDLSVTVDGYYKQFDDLVTPSAIDTDVMSNEGDGWSSGIDVLLQKHFTDRIHGHASYSFAVSERNDQNGLGPYTAPYNQPHTFTIIAGYEVTDALSVSGKWKYAVGRPTDRYIVHENVLNDEDRMRFSKEITARYADRLPDFHLLTVRADYRAQFGPLSLVTFLELDNVYDRFNTWENRFSELTGEKKALGFGFLPNVGFKLEV